MHTFSPDIYIKKKKKNPSPNSKTQSSATYNQKNKNKLPYPSLSPPTITNTKASHKTQNIKTPSPEYLL
jgi:hypothetical protein